jgi:DNA-binding transcriptional LysR family regulator
MNTAIWQVRLSIVFCRLREIKSSSTVNLSHLIYFKKLAEVKHYTKAAAELYIAQPTLSVAISSLEKELGARLFFRSNNKIELTPCGKEFYSYVSQGLRSIQKGIQVVEEYEGKINGTLNLGTLYAMQGKDWSQAVQSFHDECGSGLSINITQGFTPALYDGLESGNLDVIFAGKPTASKDYTCVHCWAQELAVAVNKNHPLAKKSSVSLKELSEYHILTYHDKSPVFDEMTSLLARSREPLDVEFGYNDEITLSSMVSTDSKQVALLCYSFLVKAFDDVTYLSLEEAPQEFHKVYLISKKNDTQPKVVSDFVTYMTNYHFPTATVRPVTK